MLEIIVSGAGGRMGRSIVSVIDDDENAILAGALEAADSPLLGRDAGELAGLGPAGVELRDSLPADRGDVLIEFTAPAATLANAAAAAERGLSMVIGTTGLSHAERETMRDHARRIPIVMAPNMSVGVNVLFNVVAEVARVLGEDYDVEVIEAHHRLKKDAPSGTAVRLGEILAGVRGRRLDEVAVYERRGFTGERRPEEIGMQTVRAGDIVGDHLVLFGGLGERLEIVHRAHSRDTFARGAVRAAHWVADQPPGLYDMQDVLGLRTSTV